MGRRNPYSTGYVAAKIRANTARRNPWDDKKQFQTRSWPQGSRHRTALKRGVEKRTRQAALGHIEEGAQDVAEYAEMRDEMRAERAEKARQRRAARAATKAAKQAAEAARRGRARVYAPRPPPWQEGVEVEEMELVPLGLGERDAPPSYRGPEYVSAAHIRAKYVELDDLYARGVISEEQHQRLRGELRYAGFLRGGGPTIGRQLKRMERRAARGVDFRAPRRKARGLPVDVWKSRIERILSDGHWEGAAAALQALAKQQKRRGKKRRQYAWEKAAWQEARRQRAVSQTSLRTPTRFTGRHASELRSLHRQQLAEAEAPWVSREEARTPDDPFAEFMFHEGAEEFYRENPPKRKKRRKNKRRRQRGR